MKLPAEKEIIRVLKNLAKKADEVIIATDFDREGELIGSDALNMVREVAPELPARRARYSALIKGEVTEAFANLVELDQDLADAGESAPVYRSHLGCGGSRATSRSPSSAALATCAPPVVCKLPRLPW